MTPSTTTPLLAARTTATACVLLALTAATARGADWEQFRGPERDGISAETGLVRFWGDDGPKELWRRPIGPAFSTISAVDGHLFTLESDDEKEYAVALGATDGQQVWRQAIGTLFRESFGDGPRSGPTWHDGRLYVVSSLGNFHALDARDGKVLWSVDFRKRYGAELPEWAFTSAPLVTGETVVVETGGKGGRAVTAFDRRTGEQRWTALDDEIVYSSPVELELGGVSQLVFLTRAGLSGLSLDGEVLWSSPFVPELSIKPAPPVFVEPDLVFASASYEAGAKMVRVKREGERFAAEDVWEHKLMRNHFNGSVVMGHHLVGFDKATLRCLDARTGEEAWAARGLGKGSLIRAGDLLVVLSERGKLVLAEASSEAWRPLASHQVLTGRSWTQPTLADGRLYVRNGNEIAAYDLREATP